MDIAQLVIDTSLEKRRAEKMLPASVGVAVLLDEVSNHGLYCRRKPRWRIGKDSRKAV
jgi:hypothetical protein